MRKVIVNTNNKTNPLKEWSDASWYYKWIKADSETAHYICLAFILACKDTVELHRPDRYHWRSTDADIRSLIDTKRRQGKLTRPGASDEMLHRLVGEEFFEADISSSRLLVKKAKSRSRDFIGD